MFGPLGPAEIIFILVLALLIFGPRRLPEVGRTVGKAMGEFRRATTELKRSVNTELALEEETAARQDRGSQDRAGQDRANQGGSAPGAPAWPETSGSGARPAAGEGSEAAPRLRPAPGTEPVGGPVGGPAGGPVGGRSAEPPAASPAEPVAPPPGSGATATVVDETGYGGRPGPGPGAESGFGQRAEPGAGRGSDPGADPGAEPVRPGADPGTEPSPDPVSGQGAEKGAPPDGAGRGNDGAG